MHKRQIDLPVTSTQPQIVKNLRIYGSPVTPYAGRTAQNQPPITGYKIYSAKNIPTISVRFKNSEDDREFVINESDFDSDIYEKVE